MSVYHKALDIRIIDSLNFLPMPLSKLPACFGLSELKKGFFPHFFNTRENQSYVGPYPDSRFYGADRMTTAARDAFMQWHNERNGEVFDFKREMLAYCRYLLHFFFFFSV